jgi:aminoglycoside phosphotransferase (APT) family kinase protein
MSDVIVAPEVRDLDALARDLAAWAGPRLPPGAREVRVENLSYPRGAGQSHETVLFDLGWTEGGERRAQGCVVRIKPTRWLMFPVDLFEEQYLLMQVLHSHGRVKVAKPLWFEADPEILGAPFFVMEKKHGRVPVSIPPYPQQGFVAEASPDQRRHMWRQGVSQLAAVQSTPLESVPFLAGADGSSGLEQEWDKYQRFVRWVSQDRRWAPLEEASAELLRNWPKNQPAGVVWGDARLGNIMFDDDFDVVAVMDWEQPSLGGALNDLAWWLQMAATWEQTPDGGFVLEGFARPEETIALWRELTGIAVDDLEWYQAFTRLKTACLGIRMFTLRGLPLPTEAELRQRLRL